MASFIQRLLDTMALVKLVGQAPTFLEAITKLPAVAKSDNTVLISGETGTGKELVARCIHYLSDRSSFPFVAINCGSLADGLQEAELFGHERGAFTGAHIRREGLIVQAESGTLFLDEVDTLPAKAQVDLLRVLQDKKFRLVGSTKEQTADVRVVAATNAQLDALVRSGRFREDLYFRLCIFSIALPPLRDRKEDILLLATYFLEKHAPINKASLKLSSSACEALLGYRWPGNVRELENAIIRGIHLSDTDSIEVGDLGLQSGGVYMPSDLVCSATKMEPLASMKREVIQKFEKAYLTHLMLDHQGNVSQAARAAGKERRNLGRLLKKHGLDRKLFSHT